MKGMNEHGNNETENWETDLEAEYADTLDWIRGLTPETPDSNEVDTHWSRYLDYWEKRLIKLNEATAKKAEHALKLVRRGWVLADTETSELIPATELKEGETRTAFPVILENTGEGWHPPVPLSMSLHLLPSVQALKRTLPPTGPRDIFLKRLNWAMALTKDEEWTNENHHARMLSQAATSLDGSMYIPLGSGKDMNWLHDARESDSFWRILDAAVNFGERLQLLEIYGDGEVEKSVKNFILSPLGKKAGPWEPVILEAIEQLETQNKPSSPAKVFKHLGGVKDKEKDCEPCSFKGAAFRDLPEISWTSFQRKAKRIRQRRS